MIVFSVQKLPLKALNVVFERVIKIIVIPQKTLTLTLHAVKALNNKLWYLRDQGTVATTNPADRQTGLQRPQAHPKDQHPGGGPHRALIKQTSTNQLKNTAANDRAKKNRFHHRATNLFRAGTAMAITPQAVLPADGQVKRNRFHREAGHIQADRQTMMTGQREALAVDHPEKRGHLHPKAGLIQAE